MGSLHFIFLFSTAGLLGLISIKLKDKDSYKNGLMVMCLIFL